MDTKSRIKINVPKVVHETIDGETVILNLDNGNYYSLVGTGAHIWAFIEKGATVQNIIEMLQCDYNGIKGDMEAEVNKFLSELIDENLTAYAGTEASGETAISRDDVAPAKKSGGASFTPPVLNKYTDMQDLLLLDPIHEVDDQAGWPNVDDKKGWPTRDPDMPRDK